MGLDYVLGLAEGYWHGAITCTPSTDLIMIDLHMADLSMTYIAEM